MVRSFLLIPKIGTTPWNHNCFGLQSWVNFSLFHGFAHIFTHPVLLSSDPKPLLWNSMTLPGFLGTFGDLCWLLGIPGCPNAQVMIPMCVWWMRGTGRLKVASPAWSGSWHTARGSPHWKFLRIFGNNSPLEEWGWGEDMEEWEMGNVGEWGRLARLVWISVRVKSGTNGWGLKDDLGVTTPVTSRVGTVSSLIYWGYTPFTKRVEPLSGLSHKVASSRLPRKVSFSQRPHGVASPSPVVKTEAVSTSWDGLVKLWDYRTQRLLCSFDEHVPSPVTALAFAPVDGRFFVTTGGDAKLALFARR